MKRIKLLIILISGFVFSQEAMFNIGSEKNERFSTALKMNDGSLFVFGQRGNCEGALSPCNGVSQEDNIDPVIYKFNSNLELEWSKEYQREYVDYFLSATVYNNHIYITGSTKANFNEPTTYDTDFLLLKVDLDGNVVWSKRLGGPCNGAETYCGDVAKKIIINNDIIFISGFYAFYGTALNDAVILKLNLDGDLIEESVINSGSGSNFFFDAVKTPTGNMLYTGRSKNGGWEPWLYYLDQQNNVLFSNTYGDQSSNADDGFKTIYHNQNFYMLTTYSGQYVNLNKIDLNGNLVWSKKFEGTNARDLLVYNNEIYIAVKNNYQNTLGIIKINTNGNLIQQKQFSYMGGGGYPVKMEIINDQLVIAGTVEYVSNGYDDIYLMTIDPFLNESPLCLEDNDWGSFYIEENNNVFQAPIGYSEYNITQINNVDLTQNPIVQNLLSNSCGCSDTNACNYNPEATISIDVCEYESCTGCIDDTACNYDPEATIGANICDYESCSGCIDETACNYDLEAIIGANICDYSCYGCMDPIACNYNPNLTFDDGSCEYIEGVNLGDDVNTCETSFTIDAGEGHDSYSWSTGETTQTITINQTGTYSVEVENILLSEINVPSEFTYIGQLNNSLYYISSESTSWLDAQNTCVELGGNLITISSEDENGFITNLLSQFGDTYSPGVWIGLNDLEEEGDFVWVSGEPLTYTNWLINQPNNFNGDESFTNMWINNPNSALISGSWNDWDNNASFGSVDDTNNLNDNGLFFVLEISNPYNCSDSDDINVTFNICGCMDSSADNFNPIASEDDGGCEYLGCMNPSACNFNPIANIDDGTCQLCSSREFNDGAYLDVDSEIINAQGLTISFWVNSDDFCENPSQFSTYIDFGSQETYRYVVRNRSCKIEAFFEGDMLPTDFDWGEMDWDYPKASAAGSLVPNGEQAGWRQVTTVFCPTTIRIYIDGEIVASNGTGVYFQEGFNLFEEDIKRIGSNQIDYEPANAIIDEVRVWNRALSGEEVLARSSTTTTLNTTEELNLNGYWKMDCDNPFLNEITNQQAVESLVVGTSVNENFNNNNCETNMEYNYDCSLDFEGNPDCNSCDPPEGCTDEEACNYDYLAIIPINDACFYVPDYCSGLEYPEYYDCDCKCINDVDVDDVCDELEVDGCSEDESACNYNPEGTQPCVFSIDLYPSGLYDCEGVCYNDNDPPTNNEGGVGDGICDEIDNCPDTYNPNQTDLNEDGIGDDCDGVGLYENSAVKNLIKIVDVLGREIKEKTKNTILIYIYDNGEIIPSYNF